jgi:perosamine synthetase
MSSMQDALGLAQLERLDESVARKRQVFQQELAAWNYGYLNPNVAGLFNSYWMTTVVLNHTLRLRKEAIIPRLKS